MWENHAAEAYPEEWELFTEQNEVYKKNKPYLEKYLNTKNHGLRSGDLEEPDLSYLVKEKPKK